MFKIKERINFYDCDPAGIMFYGNIYRVTHKAYELFLEHLFPEQNVFTNQEVVLPIIHSEADYFNPLVTSDEVEVQIKVSSLKKSSFELNYEVIKGEKICCSVKTVHVSVSKKTFEKIELPKELKERLENHLK
ncbi:MAG: acyl-CoA thioesterase [Bacteroidetes bacterium]|nr:MAG: acyl-CoA thioesterase [Bacteroidota bacterium]